jgi:hypothetical protein
LQFSQLVARSGVLSASGGVAVAAGGTLSGRVSVDLAATALIGDAVGTAVLPGISTGAGAFIGERIGEGFNKLFGKSPAQRQTRSIGCGGKDVCRKVVWLHKLAHLPCVGGYVA